LRAANLSVRGNIVSDCGSCRRWVIPVPSTRGDSKIARTDQRQTAVTSIAYHPPIDLTGHSHSTGVHSLSVPLAMSKILPRWFAESTNRLLATDGLIARDSESEEDEEEEEEDDEDDDDEDENDGYSE
jgi:hypothetical protein